MDHPGPGNKGCPSRAGQSWEGITALRGHRLHEREIRPLIQRNCRRRRDGVCVRACAPSDIAIGQRSVLTERSLEQKESLPHPYWLSPPSTDKTRHCFRRVPNIAGPGVHWSTPVISIPILSARRATWGKFLRGLRAPREIRDIVRDIYIYMYCFISLGPVEHANL